MKHPKSHASSVDVYRLVTLLHGRKPYREHESNPYSLALQSLLRAIDAVARQQMPDGGYRIAVKRNAAGTLCVCILIEPRAHGFSDPEMGR